MGANYEGPLVICAACETPQRGDMHTADGWVCKGCRLSASTIIEISWINGKKFTRCLKGLAPKGERHAIASSGRA